MTAFVGAKELLRWLCRIKKGKLFDQVAFVLTSGVLWMIWNQRNDVLFNDRPWTTSKCKRRARHFLQNISFMHTGTVSNSVRETVILRGLNIRVRVTAAYNIKEVFWVPPPPRWHKVNIDGAARGKPGNATCGGAFRNCRGFLRGSFATPLGVQTSMYEEIIGLLVAVDLVIVIKRDQTKN